MNEFSLLTILREILHWKKSIIITVIIAGVIATIIAILMPNYYKAETVFYAANPSLADPSALGYEESKRYIYGTSDDMDRIFSIVSSDEMINHLISKFNLYQHYEIDSTNGKGKNLMHTLFKDNYKVERSNYEALVLNVEDKDPIFAANIANEARIHTDQVAQNLVKQSQYKSLHLLRTNIVKQEKLVKHLADSIKQIKIQYKMVDPYFEGQTYAEEAVLTEAKLAESKAKAEFYSKYENKVDSIIKFKANSAGYASKLNHLRSNISQYYQVSAQMKKLEGEFSRAYEQISIEKEKEKLLAATYDNEFSTIHTIDVAKVPNYKSRPKRLFIVLGAIIVSFILSVFGVIMIDSFQKAKSQVS